MTKRNLLLVSLLLVFGLAVGAPSLFAQVVFQASYNTNNYVRNEGDAEAVGTVALTATNTTSGTIIAGSTITLTYNAIIASNGTSAAPKYAVGVKCSSNWPSGCPSFASTTVSVTTTTSPPSSAVVLSFPANVAGIVQSSPAMGISVAVRIVAQGHAYNSQITATVASFVPAGYILTNSVSIFSYATQPFLVATVGAEAATTSTITPASVLECVGATVPATDVFSILIAENWANALTSETDEAAIETDTNSGAPTNGSNILITLSGIPSGVTVVASAPVVCTAAAATTGVACPNGALTFGALTASTVSAGVQSFFYPVLTTNTLAIENALFNFSFSSSGPLPVGLPPINATVSLTDTYPSVSTNMPIFTAPEFTPAVPVVIFSQCTTSLVYPYVTNYNGGVAAGALGNWDTGLEVANGTSDPFAATATNPPHGTPQNGSCTFYFYNAGTSTTVGTAAEATPITFTTPVVLSGGNYAFMVSATPAKGITGGYAIAVCNFLDGAGYAEFVDNANGLGNWQVMAGYLATALTSANHQ